jgi:hypothetical protein
MRIKTDSEVKRRQLRARALFRAGDTGSSSRREIQLLGTAVIGGATFAAALSAANRAQLRNALRRRSVASPPPERKRRAAWISLPPQRYPGYYPLPYLVMERLVDDITVRALNRFRNSNSIPLLQHSRLEGEHTTRRIESVGSQVEAE